MTNISQQELGPEDLRTESSIQLLSEPGSRVRTWDSFHLDKIESHLAFMEAEFKRNIDWHKKLVTDLRGGKKAAQGSHRKADSTFTLKLKQQDEEKLREVLRDYCSVTGDRLQLPQLIQLAINLKPAVSVKQISSKKQPTLPAVQEEQENVPPPPPPSPEPAPSPEKQPSFSVIPRVITLNDLAPTTRPNLESSKASPIHALDNHLRIPKYRQAAKSPHQLFSPEAVISIKYMPEEQREQKVGLSGYFKGQCAQSETPCQYFSIGKQLQLLQGGKLGLRELEESVKNENVSLNLSCSRQECPDDKDSLLLLSDEDDANPSIYLHVKASKQPERRNEQEVLCFSNSKKRKIAKPKNAPLRDIPAEDATNLRQLKDTFGKVYHEFEQARPTIYTCHDQPRPTLHTCHDQPKPTIYDRDTRPTSRDQ